MRPPLKDQLYGVRRKVWQSSRKTIVLPDGFTFNKSGSKCFEKVLSVLDWSYDDIPVEIDFTKCNSANYQALSLLVLYAWKLSGQGCNVSIKLAPDFSHSASRVWGMMGANINTNIITDQTIRFKSHEHKPLIAIRNSDDFKTAASLFDQFTGAFGVEYQKTLRYVLSELLYNYLEHGRGDIFLDHHRYYVPGILQFTWYERINELHFVVADVGMGVKKHLSQTYSGLATDEDALRLAIQPEISGTFGHQDPYSNRNNAGMGLFISSNILRRLRADMYLISGRGVVHISPVDTTSNTLKGYWPGTIALVTVRLGRGTNFALDLMMNEFRAQAREEVNIRNKAAKEDQFLLSIYNYFGRFADDKAAAISYRDKYLMPAVDEGKSIIVDFNEVASSTHSFLNALLASPIRKMGLLAYKRIRIINALSEIRETVDYILDDNTGGGADESKYD